MIEPLVLLPGFKCDARSYTQQVVALSHHRAVTVAPVSDEEQFEGVALAVLSQLPHRFALASIGFGGMVAVEIIRMAPERVSRLCLIVMDAQADSPHAAAGREDLIIAAKVGRLDEAMRKVIGSDCLAPEPERISVLNEALKIAEDLGKDLFVRQMRALPCRPGQQGTLRRINVPSLIICGAHDTLTPVKKHSFMADLTPGAELCVIKNAGHLPTPETPEQFANTLESWMQKPGPVI